MVQDSPSSRETPKDEPDILDLKANPADADPAETAGERLSASGTAFAGDRTMADEPSEEPHPDIASAGPQTAAPAGHPTSSLIGAGILGGLIALAAAASMQYAGYWPGSASTATKQDTAGMDGLRAEIDGIKTQLASIQATPASDPTLEKRIAALEGATKSGANSAETANALKSVQQTVDQVKTAASSAAQEADARIADLTTRLAAAEKTLKDQPGEAAVSKAIAATYLKAAVDRGEPFLTELQTFSSLAPEDPAVAGLKPLAAAGVKSRAALLREFDDAAKAALEATDQPVAGESLTDRLFASARTLVSVRPVGNVEGTDTGAILARIEDKLKNGDVKGASLEWDGLPEPARKATADFKASLDRRVKADDLTRGLTDRSSTPAVKAG